MKKKATTNPLEGLDVHEQAARIEEVLPANWLRARQALAPHRAELNRLLLEVYKERGIKMLKPPAKKKAKTKTTKTKTTGGTRAARS